MTAATPPGTKRAIVLSSTEFAAMRSLLGRCILLAICLLALVSGGVLVFFGWQQRTLFVKCSEAPVKISLAELEKKGAGDNVYYQITDFTMGSDFITEEDRQGNVTRAWVPLYAATAESGPSQVQVVLLTKQLSDSSDEAIGRYRQKRKTLTALVVNDVQSLGSREKANLEEHYPSTNFTGALLLEDEREPPTAALVYGLLGGGGGLIFLGVLCGAWP